MEEKETFFDKLKRVGKWIWSKLKYICLMILSAVALIFGIKLLSNKSNKEKEKHDSIKNNGENIKTDISDIVNESEKVVEKTEEIQNNVEEKIEDKKEFIDKTMNEQKKKAEEAGFKKVE